MARFVLELIGPRPTFAFDMSDAEGGFACEIHPMRAVTRDTSNETGRTPHG